MKQVQIDKHSFSIPESWKEVTDEQFRFIAIMLASNPNPNEMLLKIFMFITGIEAGDGFFTVGDKPFVSIKINDENVLIGSEELAYATMLLKWIFHERRNAEGDITYEFRCDRINNPVPKLKCGKTILHGPADGLTNITWGEYIYASSNLYWYAKSKQTSFLVKAAAILYREEGERTDSDCRIPFDSDKCEYRELIIRKAKMEDLLMINLWFQSCQTFLRSKFPHPYEGGGTATNDNPFDNYIRMTTAMAQHNAPSLSEWMKTELYVVLASLDEQIKNAKPKPK